MNRSTIRLIIILGTISVMGIVLIQIYWMKETFDIKKNQFNQNVNIILKDVAEIIFNYNNQCYKESCEFPYHNPVDRISSNYYVVNVNCEINPKILEHYLKVEFERRNILIDMEYAIYDCSSDEMVYGNYISFHNDSIQFEPQHLPKCEKYNYYFGVYFPSLSTYITGNMDIWFFFSAILLFVIIFFTYSMHIILKQRRLTEVQKDFINNMTHEFKTPLSSISISADVLNKDDIYKEPERIKKYVSIIKEQNLRLQSHVERVLKIATLDNKNIKLNKEWFNLHDKVQDVITDFKQSIPGEAMEVEWHQFDDEFFVLADPVHFANIFLNILENSYKYSNKKPKVVVSAQHDGNKVIIFVEDNGIGIKKEHIKRIFNRFYRVPTGDVHNVKGFGLGLNYVYTIIKIHKWKIKAESEYGKGTKFVIIIPEKNLRYEQKENKDTIR